MKRKVLFFQRGWWRRIALALAIAMPLGLLTTSYAGGENLNQVQTLVEAGRLQEALGQIQIYLREHPRDAEGRFLNGVILANLSRVPEAIQVFTELSRDYPQLPEPYNNIAVLYAQQGDYQKARDALEAALAAHPDYAVAHENLGDIYAAMANSSYTRALSLQQSNPTIRSKIDILNRLDGGRIAQNTPEPPAKPTVPTAAPAPEVRAYTVPKATAVALPVLPVSATPAPFLQPPTIPLQQAQNTPKGIPPVLDAITQVNEVVAPSVVAATSPTNMTAAIAAAPTATPAPAAASGPVVVAQPPEPVITPVQVSETRPQAPASAVATGDVVDAVLIWAKYWSARDVESYLSMYDSSFTSVNHANREIWAQERRTRLGNAKNIAVKILNPQVQLLPDGQAQVTFVQVYQSDSYKDRTQKVLTLKRSQNTWKILREQTV